MPHSSVLKRRQRREAKAIRAGIVDPSEREAAIHRHLQSFEPYQRARTILFYLAAEHEISLDRLIEAAWEEKRRVVVPFCEADHLRIFEIASWEELENGSFGIREPKLEVRNDTTRELMRDELDFILLPGLAFDRFGGRLGYGKGFYDRFLNGVFNAVPLVGIASEETLFPAIPMTEHDVFVSAIATDQRIYDCRVEKSDR